MPKRYAEIFIEQTKERLSLGHAIRLRLKEGYSAVDFRADIFAGAIVALVALPLAMALSIASGVEPQHGIFTVIVAGFFVALLGGSNFQVSGPTAAFVVVLAPVAQRFGLEGLLMAGFMAGILLFIMGLARFGKFIQFIPHPVTTGFTTGIALVIATLQLKDLLGLSFVNPDSYLEKLRMLAEKFPALSWPDLCIGLFAFVILLVWPRLKTVVPAPLVALVAASVVGALLKSYYPEFSLATIGTRFGNPNFAFTFDWPWNFSDGAAHPLNFEAIRALLPSAFAIAVLGAIESLLSATIADGMAQTKHDSDTELMALGVGNILCPFVGGIPATGAIARTAANIRFGARSPIAAMLHALITLVCVVLFADWIVYLPMAALAALLLLVAYNISDIGHFVHITRVAPRSDVIVLWTCFLLTVVFDMVVGVTAGVILAALLFMRRMATVTSTRMLEGPTHPHKNINLPHDVIVYEIVGPLFFGAAENAIGALRGIGNHVRAIVFVLEDVPIMDITGLVAFESTIKRFIGRGKTVYLVGLAPQPLELLTQAGVIGEAQHVRVFKTLEQALEDAG